MHRTLSVALLFVLLATAGVHAATPLPDAVTRATTLNPHTGDVAALSDGVTLLDDPDAASISWNTVGLVVVEFPGPVTVASIRVYVGLLDRYGVYAYMGGRFSDTGTREEVEDAVYLKEGIGPYDEEGWFEIDLPTDEQLDNLGFQIIGGGRLYEMEFYGPNGTPVTPISFGLIKRAQVR